MPRLAPREIAHCAPLKLRCSVLDVRITTRRARRSGWLITFGLSLAAALWLVEPARADLNQRYFVGNFLGYSAQPYDYISLSGSVSRSASSGLLYVEKMVSPVSSLSLSASIQHYGGNDHATGWNDLDFSYKQTVFQWDPSDFLVSFGPNLEVPNGDESVGASPHTKAGADLLFVKGLTEVPDSLAALRAFQLEGDYFWDANVSGTSENLLFTNTEIEYSIGYLDKYVAGSQVNEFLSHLTPHLDFEYSQYLTTRDNSTAPDFQLTPGIAWINRIFMINLGLQIGMNHSSTTTGNVGFVWLFGVSFDEVWPALGWTPFK
jgi:hypothetical protein